MLWQLWNSGFSTAPRASAAKLHASVESLLIHSLLRFGNSAACLLEWRGSEALPHCVQVSPNFSDISGLEMGQCFQSGLMQHFGPEEQTLLLRHCAEATHIQAPLSFTTLDEESRRAIEWSVLPAEPNNSRRVLLVRDATSEYQMQRAVERAENNAQLALRSRDEFLANMSHELRTPLNAVLGFAQMMEQQVFGRIQNPTYREYIRKIQESGHDLLGKISDLLQMGSIDTGAENTEMREPLALDALLYEVVEHVSHHAFRRNVTLQPVLLDPSPMLLGDRLALRQGLLHVMINAVKHGAEGEHVQVVCRAHRDGGVALHIRDKGPGMSARMLQQINQGLKRPLLERGRDDLGMGLAIANHHLRAHGGRIDIKSRPGQGTEVVLWLPAERVEWPKPIRGAARKVEALAS